MEHRASYRFKADLKIIICRENLLIDTGVITDMNNKGVFIQSGFKSTYINQPLEIEFCLDDIQALSNARFKAKVVHKEAQGFGAEVEDTYAEIPMALRRQSEKSKFMASNRREFKHKKLFLHIG